MADKRKWLSPGAEKRGGYSGSKPAAMVGPPEKVPSGEIKPETTGDRKAAAAKK